MLLLAGCAGSIAQASDTQPAGSAAQREAALGTAIEEYTLEHPGLITAVEVSDGKTHLGYSERSRFETASLAKLEILVRWLQLRQRYYIPDEELALAEKMMTRSDNEAATRLCRIVAEHGQHDDPLPGGTGTCVNNAAWGADETTVAEQHKMLKTAFDSEVLNASSRGVVSRLMGAVVPEQSWGASAASRTGESYWLKNGWDVRDNGWVVHTTGVIETRKDELLYLTVLTDGNASHAEGIAHVENVVKLARQVLAP